MKTGLDSSLFQKACNMKGKFIIISILVVLLGYTVYQMMSYEQSLRSEKIIREYIEDESVPLVEKPSPEALQQLADKVNYYFQTSGDIFQNLRFGNEEKELQWDAFLMKGVNLGVALPGKFPAEFSMTMKEYFQWLQMIGQMNANIVRIYTILPPEFYQAFAQYNLLHEDKPLYLLQGVWAPVPESHNYLEESYSRTIQKEIVDVIDVLHGNAVLPPKKGKAHGVYSADVSRYVAGILFGREWEPDGVVKTNQLSVLSRFQGDFIGVHDASPMEVWLAKMMDFLILYETMTYSMQHPVSFVNWLPLDPLFHQTEFIENEKVREYDNDLETVDFMRFHATPAFFPGLFAAYHAYPYYPDFVFLDAEYAQYTDLNGTSNNYQGYLKDLKNHHPGMPLVIAEYGLPSSRGKSHQTPFGLDQGGHDEWSHARLNSQLTRDIFESGCAGALYFEWADEWFKHNWLVMDFEVPFEHRKRWHNMENPEQNFGVLALESEKKVLDGLLNDWNLTKIKKQEIYTASDPTYLYIMAPLEHFDFAAQNFYLAFDVIPGEQGDHRLPFSDKKFKNGFEFLLEIIDKDSARILVDEPFSVYTDIYNDQIPGYRSVSNENGDYIEQLLLTNRGRESLKGSRFDSLVFNRSTLIFGNSNDPGYSNADWFYEDSTGILEIRLTWHLLNVTDPSIGCVLDNKKETPEIDCTQTSGITLQAFVTNSSNEVLYNIPKTKPFFHEWQVWEEPSFRQRLKPLYDSLRVCFKHNYYRPFPTRTLTRKEETFEVCHFYKDFPKALSVRLEKGTLDQYEIAKPILQKYDKNATFYLEEEATQTQAGYSLNASGKRQKSIGAEGVAELKKTGHQVATGEPPKTKNTLQATECSAASLFNDLLAKKQDWTILQYGDFANHSVTGNDNGKAGVPQISGRDFERHLRLLRNLDYWIATEEKVFKYQEERDVARIKINQYGQFQFLTITTGLNPADFDQPLSFYYHTQAPKIEVSGSEDDGFYENRNGKVLLNAKPGSEVTIKKIW